MPNVGPMELIIILIIALVVFGPKKLPELGRSLGSGLREFRDSISGKGEKPPTGAAEEDAPESSMPPELPRGSEAAEARDATRVADQSS